MKDKTLNELKEAVGQAGEIVRGEREPSRTYKMEYIAGKGDYDIDGFEIFWDWDVGEEHGRFEVVSGIYRWINAIIHEGRVYEDPKEFNENFEDDWQTWQSLEETIQHV